MKVKHVEFVKTTRGIETTWNFIKYSHLFSIGYSINTDLGYFSKSFISSIKESDNAINILLGSIASMHTYPLHGDKIITNFENRLLEVIR